MLDDSKVDGQKALGFSIRLKQRGIRSMAKSLRLTQF